MDIQSFFQDLKTVQDESARTLGDVRARQIESARLIATAEYELLSLQRELKRGIKVGSPGSLV